MEKYIVYLKVLKFLTLGVGAGLIGGVLLVFVVIPQVLQEPSFYRFIEKHINKKAPFQIYIEKMSWKPFRSLTVQGRTVVQWKSEDQVYMVDNFKLPFVVILYWPQKEGIELDFKGEIGGGEVVWNTFYGNFKNQTFQIYSRLRAPLSFQEIEVKEAVVSMRNKTLLSFKGRVKQNPKVFAAFDAHSEISDLSSLRTSLLDILGETYPILKELTIRGKGQGKVRLQGGLEELDVEGEISVKEGAVVSRAKKTDLKNLNIRFPFHFSKNILREPASAKRYGTLSFDALNKNGVGIGKTKIKFLNHNNALVLEALERPSLWEGKFKLRQAAFQAFPADQRSLTLSLKAQDIAYEKLSQFLGMPSWPGKLYFNIDSMTFDAAALKFSGSIELLAWNGKVTLQDIEILDPLFVPTVKVRSIAVEGVRLGELTQTFGFGIIDGGLEAKIENFAMVENRPISFKMSAESVPQEGTKQIISVDAIKNISKLGGDESSFINDQVMYKFVKQFGYSKFGFKAELEGDVLQIAPKYFSGDTYYLIKGSFWPPTVDIVYKNDLQSKIPLPELWDRLKNIDWKKTVVK
ncbi:MAG: hypothetical protein HYY61_04440 [Deltaproteobacteria bacterium]|nr:hypothetical protein [Deltaproteobacteria bacterium]